MDSSSDNSINISPECSRLNFAPDDIDQVYANPNYYYNNKLNSKSTYISTATTHFGQKNHYYPTQTSQPQKQQQYRHLPYRKWKLIEKLAAARKDEGITFVDVQRTLKIGKRAAQYLLRNFGNDGKLYTCGRRKPQHYFLSKEDAELWYLKCTHFNHTGVRQPKPKPYLDYHPPSPSEAATSLQHRLELETQEQSASLAAAKSLLQVMAKEPNTPLGIHNLHIKLTLNNPHPADDSPYDRIPSCYLAPGKEGSRNRTKLYTQPIGDKLVTYRFHPNTNTATITIDCSDNPFPLDSEEHITALFSFLGGRHETLRVLLSDRSNQFVPPVHDWFLTEADLNRDIRITPFLHYAIKDQYMELRVLEGVFREYAKIINARCLLRKERMLSNPVPLTKEALYNLMAGNDAKTSYDGGDAATDAAEQLISSSNSSENQREAA